MDDLDRFFANLEKDVQGILVEKVIPKVENIVHEKSTEIYDEYEPWGQKYNRRYENNIAGSYGDRQMINTEIQGNIKNGEINTLTTNDSLANGEQKGEYLDSIIEYGGEYTWSHDDGNGQAGRKEPYDFPLPRPVFQRAMEEIEFDNILGGNVTEGLKAKGYTIT